MLGRDEVDIDWKAKPKKDSSHVKSRTSAPPRVVLWEDIKQYLAPNSVRVAERTMEKLLSTGCHRTKQSPDLDKVKFFMYKHSKKWGSLYAMSDYRVPTLLRVINGTKRKARGLDRNNGKYKVYWLLTPGVAPHGGVLSAIAWSYGESHYEMEGYDFNRT